MVSLYADDMRAENTKVELPIGEEEFEHRVLVEKLKLVLRAKKLARYTANDRLNQSRSITCESIKKRALESVATLERQLRRREI